MGTVVLHGGQIFDGTGSPVADGDVLVSDGMIADVGTGLDGDEHIDVSGLTPGAGFRRLPRARDQLRRGFPA